MGWPQRVYDSYVFDCDGTIYVGESPLPCAVETLRILNDGGAQSVFLTNRPTNGPVEYAKKLRRMGIAVEDADVVSSVDALLAFLSRERPCLRLVVIGEPFLEDKLRAAGFEIVDTGDCTVDFVVVSFDRTFVYAKLKRAFDAVSAGARIVATNPDRYCPSPDGGLPDCGALLAAVETCTGARAEAIVGKPSEEMAAVVLGRLRAQPSDTLMVGDRLETDMAMARRMGMDFALVLTGATSANDVVASADKPDFVLASLSDLLPDRSGRSHEASLQTRRGDAAQ